MLKLINRTGKFLKELKRHEALALEEMGKFGKDKMDEYVAVDTGYLKSRNTYKINRNELYLMNDCRYAINDMSSLLVTIG
jgi:hypothetical protein